MELKEANSILLLLGKKHPKYNLYEIDGKVLFEIKEDKNKVIPSNKYMFYTMLDNVPKGQPIFRFGMEINLNGIHSNELINAFHVACVKLSDGIEKNNLKTIAELEGQ